MLNEVKHPSAAQIFSAAPGALQPAIDLCVSGGCPIEAIL